MTVPARATLTDPARSHLQWIAVDPGPEQSGYVLYQHGQVLHSGVLPNVEILPLVWWSVARRPSQRLALEMIASYGMAVGKEVFETCVWIGRFMQLWGDESSTYRITRAEIKLHLCQSPRAKDTNIRQALLDRFGPVGTKKAPGPLHGVKSHAWAALALAVTADDLYGGLP